MQCNVGKTDKILRVVVGVLIIAAGIYFKSWWGAIGLLPIATGLCKYCPLYPLLGITTCKVEKAEDKKEG